VKTCGRNRSKTDLFTDTQTDRLTDGKLITGSIQYIGYTKTDYSGPKSGA